MQASSPAAIKSVYKLGQNKNSVYTSFFLVIFCFLSMLQLRRRQGLGKVEEVDAGAIDTILVDKVRCDPAREQGALVRLGQTLEKRVNSNLLDERLGNGTTEDTTAAWNIIKQIRRLELCLEVIELARELVRNKRAWLGTVETLEFALDTAGLKGSIIRNDGLDVANVALVKGRGLVVFEDHEINVLRVGKSQASEHLKRRRSHTTLKSSLIYSFYLNQNTYLVRARVLEQNHTALLQIQPRLLRNEQVCTLDNILEVWLSVVVDQARHVRNVNSLGTTTKSSAIGSPAS